MIELKSICKVYNVGGTDFYALKDVSIEINKGEFVAICGASGSGKTTLLNIIGCMDSYDSGEYLLSTKNIGDMKDAQRAKIRNRQIGFVLQDFALINRQTVQYNVMLPLLFSDIPYSQITKRVCEALKIVGLADQSKKLANQLSGGQRQRVAIARAIVTEPQIILADEPTGQLDSATGRQIMELLTMLNQNGATIIMVTHDNAVAKYASRRILLSDGRIVRGDILG